MTLFKDLLFNLLFILAMMLAVQYLIHERRMFALKSHEGKVSTISAMIQVFFCMMFSYPDQSGLLYDLRLIPLVITGLYGGFWPLLSLFAFTVLMRIPFGGSGVEFSLFMTLSAFLAILLSNRYYHTLLLAGKLTLVAGIAFLYAGMLVLIKAFYFQIDLEMSQSTIYGFTLSIGMVIAVYTMEIIKQNRLLKDAIVKSEKIEVVSHLAASVSHEVRNPMTVTRGFLQMLKDPSLSQEKKEFYLNTAIDELDRAEQIIKDYLNFSKPEAIMEPSILNIGEEIEKVQKLLSPYANHSSVNIRCEVDPKLLIIGDDVKLHQCLMNLLKNGIEAMPDGGNLVIQAYRSTKGFAAIKISDTGIGMTTKQIKKLGEPYFSTKKENGTGLGMMVVYKLIDELGGTLDAFSSPHNGTQFTITLPLVNEG